MAHMLGAYRERGRGTGQAGQRELGDWRVRQLDPKGGAWALLQLALFAPFLAEQARGEGARTHPTKVHFFGEVELVRCPRRCCPASPRIQLTSPPPPTLPRPQVPQEKVRVEAGVHLRPWL